MAKTNKTASTRSRNKITLAPDEWVTIGIDVHADSYSIAIFSINRETIIKQWVQKPSHLILINKLEPIKERIKLIVYEAGPCGYDLARDLLAHQHNVKIVSPAHAPQIPANEVKTDRLDAIKLARQASNPYCLHFVTVPTIIEELDRQVFRSRELIMRDIRATKSRIKSLLLQYHIEKPEGLSHWSLRAIEQLKTITLPSQLRLVVDSLIADLDHQLLQKKLLTAELRKMSRSPRYCDTVDRITAIPGIGFLTAMAFLLEMYQLDRFESKHKVAKMVGLAPAIRSSGKTVRQGRVNKDGKSYLKPFLVEAAWRWVGKDPNAYDKYIHLYRNTASKKKAIVAMARRLATVFWVLGTSPEKTYDSSKLVTPDQKKAA